MPDAALGQCDMVLAVAQDTIDYQFSQLWKRGVIENMWKVLVRNQPPAAPVVKAQSSDDFDSLLQVWQTTQQNLAAQFAAGNFEAYGVNLGAALSSGALWDYGWTGMIEAPAITVLETDTENLRFTITFASGTLFSCSDTTKPMSTWGLAGVVYAFTVPVGRLEITSTQEILTPEGQDQAAKVIRDSGLTEADFSIGALFMDFENADIANFDATASHFPADATTAIQVTVEDYFKLVVAAEANPFVLGYPLALKQVTGTALFEPTSTRFSTSYSSQAGCSAFNFLMMRGGNDFPAGEQVGVLPVSLLENASLGDGDGVFGIDWTLFDTLLIEPFVTAIAPKVTSAINPATAYARTAQTWSLSADVETTTDVDDPPSDLLKDTHQISTRSVTSSLALTNVTQGLQLACVVSFDVQLRVMCWEVLHDGYHTEYFAELSTSGTAALGPTGTAARPGTVQLTIQPGAEGAIDFTVGTALAPSLGYVTQPDTGSRVTVGDWGIVQADWDAAGAQDLAQGAIDASAALGSTMTDVMTGINAAIASVATGKVILPLGQLYTFKQVRLRDPGQTDDDSVLLNVSYAPVS
jgi:hypothetical protein